MKKLKYLAVILACLSASKSAFSATDENPSFISYTESGVQKKAIELKLKFFKVKRRKLKGNDKEFHHLLAIDERIVDLTNDKKEPLYNEIYQHISSTGHNGGPRKLKAFKPLGAKRRSNNAKKDLSFEDVKKVIESNTAFQSILEILSKPGSSEVTFITNGDPSSKFLSKNTQEYKRHEIPIFYLNEKGEMERGNSKSESFFEPQKDNDFREKVEYLKNKKVEAEAARIAQAKAEADRIAQEKAEAKAEADRIEKEKADKKAKAEAARIEKEKADKKAKAQAEADKKAKEVMWKKVRMSSLVIGSALLLFYLFLPKKGKAKKRYDTEEDTEEDDE